MLKFARPIRPGEFLREEYLLPLGMSAGSLAKKLNLPRTRIELPRTRIERVANEEIGVTPDTALRLGRFFGTTPEFWMNFQQAYELETEAKKLAPELDKIEPLKAAWPRNLAKSTSTNAKAPPTLLTG